MAEPSTMTLVDEPTPAAPAAPVATEPAPEPVPTAEPTPEPTVTPSPTPEEPKETRFQRRINQLTRKVHDLERQLTSTQVPTTPAAPSAPATSDQKPQEGEFADYGQYVEALTDWKVRQTQRETARETAERQEQARIASLSRDFAPQLETARAQYEDFDDVVSQPIFTPLTQELLWQSPQGAEIAYYLGTHPQEAATLNALSPMAAARRLVALEVQIQQAATPAKTVSTAPPPISPVAGPAAPVKDPNNMTTDEWMAWDRQQRLERLKTRPLSI